MTRKNFLVKEFHYLTLWKRGVIEITMFFIQRQGVSKQKVNLIEEENILIKCVRICFVQQYKDLIILF